MSRFPDVRFLLSAAAPAQFPADHGVEIAFAGRSNAGKSTAINVIVGRHALARTSKTPGRTRLLNFFELAPQRRIVDLPGYGYASVPEIERRQWVPLTDALRNRGSLRGLFLIVDARRGFTDADAEVVAWCNPAVRHVHVLLSKADKLNRREADQVLRQAAGALGGVGSVQLFSALKKTGVADAQQVLQRLLADGGDTVKDPGGL